MESCWKVPEPSKEMFWASVGPQALCNCFRHFWDPGSAQLPRLLPEGRALSLAQSAMPKRELTNQEIMQAFPAAPLGAKHPLPSDGQPLHTHPPGSTAPGVAASGTTESQDRHVHHKPICLEIPLSCSKRCDGKINLNNDCPQLAWASPGCPPGQDTCVAPAH